MNNTLNVTSEYVSTTGEYLGSASGYVNTVTEFIRPGFIFVKDLINMLPFEPYINYLIVAILVGYFVGRAMLFMQPWKLSFIVGLLVFLLLLFI